MSVPAGASFQPVLPARRRTAMAATYVVVAFATAYGAMKLWWGLGGDMLKAQTPLPRAAQENLVSNDGAMTVASHWLSVLLAVVGILVAWGIATERAGRRLDRLLRIGAWVVGALMVARALGVFGFGLIGDTLTLGDVGSVDDPRYAAHVARWDLFLWSPFWLLFGVAWVVVAYAQPYGSNAEPERKTRLSASA